MPKSRHFGAGSDTMQQVHGAGVKSNIIFSHPVSIPARTTLATSPEAVDSNAPASVHLVFVIFAAIKYTDIV